ncbi:MAG: polyribonucleotide nucleotidyltransferase [Alteromonas naphthalenivorans]|jgi:polyribonucleotide nucleotidyltransferase
MSKNTFEMPKQNITLKVNELARQADGSALLQQGGTVLLATVVSAPAKDFPGFFPLMVDYREPFASAGKIPGGFFKREGKSTDREVLTSRIIDRAIRPLFPKDYFNQLQVNVTVYSVDKKHAPHALAALAVSTALSVSKVPFIGPVGIAEIGRIDDKWVINPNYEQLSESDVKITVVGTKDGICMVEGATNEITEEEFIEALFLAHDSLKEQVEWQEEIVKEYNPVKEGSSLTIDWDSWEKRSRDFLTSDRLQTIFDKQKAERKEAIKKIKEDFATQFEQELTTDADSKPIIDYILDAQLKERLTAVICEQSKRVDGRSFDQVRSIETKVGLLPFTHGSAVFTRGSTQSLATLTLGSGQDEQKIEDIMGGEVDGSFMLHYNFPPFSVGEVRPLRPPSRREVGHGHLAASAFRYILPDKDSFPYTIRVVSDILESDGSSSMATVCSSTMAFLNGGVPIKDMVGGVAMGLLKSDKSDFKVLTDITGFEDAFGLMDFKVAGTESGITAIQMDIKYKGGLPREIFEKSLAQAKTARLHIIGEMKKVMSKPNENMSDLVPQVASFKIDSNKIGAVIGSGGKVIRDIIDKTATSIDIEDDGMVKIFGQPGQGMERAVLWVKTLAGQIEKGMVFDGVVRRIADFGIFVELVPGKDGLVHVSAIPREEQRDLEQHYPTNSSIKVEVVEYDKELDRVRLRFVQG